MVEFACNAGDQGSIPGLGRSFGEGNANPLYYLAWRIPWDTEDWQATVHGVAKSQTRLSNYTLHCYYNNDITALHCKKKSDAFF